MVDARIVVIGPGEDDHADPIFGDQGVDRFSRPAPHLRQECGIDSEPFGSGTARLVVAEAKLVAPVLEHLLSGQGRGVEI